jgi:hypothetical protein
MIVPASYDAERAQARHAAFDRIGVVAQLVQWYDW